LQLGLVFLNLGDLGEQQERAVAWAWVTNRSVLSQNPHLLKIREVANRQGRTRGHKDLQLKENTRRRDEAAGTLKKNAASLKSAQSKLAKAQSAMESGATPS
jgi:hypothetical protein